MHNSKDGFILWKLYNEEIWKRKLYNKQGIICVYLSPFFFNEELALMSISYCEKIRNNVGFSRDCFMFMPRAKISATMLDTKKKIRDDEMAG